VAISVNGTDVRLSVFAIVAFGHRDRSRANIRDGSCKSHWNFMRAMQAARGHLVKVCGPTDNFIVRIGAKVFLEFWFILVLFIFLEKTPLHFETRS